MDKFMNFAKNVAKVSELTTKKLSRVAAKNELLFHFGEQVYSHFPTLDIEAINTMIADINRLDFEIESLDEAINYAKGMKVCKNCGSVMKNDMTFCGKCGTKFEDSMESDSVKNEDKYEEKTSNTNMTDEDLFSKDTEVSTEDTEA